MLKLFNAKNQKLGRNIMIYDSVLNLYSHELFSIKVVKFTESDKEPVIYTETEKSVELYGISNCSVYVPNQNMSVVLRVEDMNREGYMILVKRMYQDGTEDKTDLYQDLLTNKGLEGINLSECINPGYDGTELRKKLLLDLYKIFQNKGTKDSVENFFKFLCYDNDDNFSITDILENEEKTGFYTALYQYWRLLGNGYDENNLPDFDIPSLELDKFLKHLTNAINIANDYFTAEEQIIKLLDIRYNCNVPVFENYKMRNNLHSFYDTCDFRSNVLLTVFTNDNGFYNYNIKSNVLSEENIPVKEVMFLDYASAQTSEFRQINREYQPSDSIPYSPLFDSEVGAVLNCIVSYPNYKPNQNLYYSLQITNGTETFIQNKSAIARGNSVTFKFFARRYATYRFTFIIYDEFGTQERYFYNLKLKPENLRIDFDVYSSKYTTPLHPNGQYQRDSKPTQPNESYTPVSLVFPDKTINSVELPQSVVPNPLSRYYDVTPPANSRWFQDFVTPDFPVFNKNYKLKDVTTMPISITENYIDIAACLYQTGDVLYFRVYDSTLGDYKFVTMTQFAALNHPLDLFMAQAMTINDQGQGNLLIDANDDYVIDENDNYIATMDPASSPKPYWIFTSIMCGVEVPVTKLFIKRNNQYLCVKDLLAIRKRQQIFTDIPVNIHINALASYCSDSPYTEIIDGTTFPSIKCMFSHLTRDREHTDSYGLKLNDVTLIAFNLKYDKLPVECSSTIKETFEGTLLSSQNHPTNIYRIKTKDILDFDIDFKLRNNSYHKKLQSYQAYDES